jgi:phosphohistidine phosphatase SixA
LREEKKLSNKICQWCDDSFDTVSKNQIYCSPTCRAESTKKKIVERYQISKFKARVGKERRCAGGCNTLISVYNDAGFCNSCLVNDKKVDKFIKELKDYFDYEEK